MFKVLFHSSKPDGQRNGTDDMSICWYAFCFPRTTWMTILKCQKTGKYEHDLQNIIFNSKYSYYFMKVSVVRRK